MEIFDLHNDFFTEIFKDKAKLKYLLSKKNANLRSLISAVWTSRLGDEQAIDLIENAYDFITKFNQNAKNKNHQIYADSSLAKLFLGVEDLHFVNKTNLLRLINAHPICVGLTWNNDNKLAGGAHGISGLTDFGADVVKQLEENNIQIDTAHLNEKSFMDLAKLSTRPLFCSHSAVKALVNNPRNLKDYQLRMIAESGGVVGISLVGSFLTDGKRASVVDVARHIDYAVCHFGESHVCLGTDFFGTKNLPKKVKSYADLDLLENRLRFMGYDSDSVEKIFYKNAQRFFNINCFI